MKKIILVLISILITAHSAYCQSEYKSQGYKAENASITELTGEKLMPVNSNIEVLALNTISSEFLKKGDKVVFYFPTDLYYGKNFIVPTGTKLNGMIVYVQSAAGKKSGNIKVRFSSMVTPNGQVIPISAEYCAEAENGNVVIKQNEKIIVIINQPITVNSNTPY